MTSIRAMSRFLCTLFLVTAAMAILSAAASPQQNSPLAPRRGVLLIADKSIDDPRFEQSVVLLIHHDMRYTAGLIINKPTQLLPSDLIPPLPQSFNRIYYGGPVQSQQPHVLLRSPNPPATAQTVLDDIYYLEPTQVRQLLPALKSETPQLRAYFGYAGWAAGQLAREIGRGDWHLLPADEAAVFSADPESLWSQLYAGINAVWI
jgi:putative transcriptional regulator